MKRTKSVVAVAAMMAMSVVMAVPAVADDGRGERLEERVENRIDNLEDRYDVDIDEDVAFFGNPFLYYYGDDDVYEEVLDEVYDVEVDLD
jgi:hypothetical protein